MVYGCTNRHAKRLKAKINRHRGEPVETSISVNDLAAFHSVHPDAVYHAMEVKKKAFLSITDLSRFLSVGQRQGANYSKSLRLALKKEKHQLTTVFEFGLLLDIPPVYIFALLDESIQEPGILSVKNQSYANILVCRELPNQPRILFSIAERSNFWDKYPKVFQGLKNRDYLKFFAP